MTSATTAPEAEAPSETVEDVRPLPLRIGAELLGTFIACFAIYVFCTFGSIVFSLNLAYIAIGTGLVYMAVTLFLGRISGGQFNPAITVAAMLTGKTKVLDGILYIIFQVVGAGLAGLLIKSLLPVSSTITAKQWLTTAVNGFDKGSIAYTTLQQYGLNFSVSQAAAVEIVAALVIIAVAMTQYGKKNYAAYMGVAYAFGAAIAFPVTGAALNPARATGIALFAYNQDLTQNPLTQLWLFWVCPVLAAAVVALAMMVRMPKKGDDPSKLNDYDENADAAQESTDSATAAETEGNAEAKASEAEVRNEQADAKADSDEGVERD
ncbi:glycerol transporter [Bifidobacterium sp. DSM 109960]|uniref:Glycerol transporter n=1 Tax=Bifidobacterium erythrocebi TaxID=2675325 RepID=A0A7Y0HV03_9BIFI|nr:aquaporin [Bifidobacterium sp. DSM 109960]NMM96123.1 glycerol transporter [Bifidobacterium sp. DSM 109960]